MSAFGWITRVFCLLLIAACSREVVEVGYVGKIKHTKVFNSPVFDLDSYHRPLVRQSFCTIDHSFCLEAGGRGGGLTWDSNDSESAGRLLVTLETDAQEKLITGTYLFDTTNGTSIVCEGCGWEKEQFYGGAWLHKGQILLSPAGPGPDGQSRMRVIEIEGSKATQRYITMPMIVDSHLGKGGNWFVSPQNDAVAMFRCTQENCWLRWLSGELNEMHIQSVNCAKEPEYLTVYWEHDVPHIAQTAWATGVASRHRCKDANGRPMYPILNRDVYSEGRSATAADIKADE